MLVKLFTTRGKLLRGRVLEVPEFVLHPAVKFLRVLFPLHVKLVANRGVDSNGEVIVDYVVRYAVLIRFPLFLLIEYLYLPSVHHNGRGFLDFLENFVDRLALVTAAPTQTSGKIVPRTERYNTDGRLMLELYSIHSFQDPANGAVATATNYPEVLDVLEHLQALHRTTYR